MAGVRWIDMLHDPYIDMLSGREVEPETTEAPPAKSEAPGAPDALPALPPLSDAELSAVYAIALPFERLQEAWLTRGMEMYKFVSPCVHRADASPRRCRMAAEAAH